MIDTPLIGFSIFSMISALLAAVDKAAADCGYAEDDDDDE